MRSKSVTYSFEFCDMCDKYEMGKIRFNKAQSLLSFIFNCQNVIFKRRFWYDKVYGGVFWYINVYKEYLVIWYTFVKTGYGGIFLRKTENLSDSLGKHDFSSHNVLKRLQTCVILHIMHIVCFDVEMRVPAYPVLSDVKYHRNINHGI